MLTQPDSAWWSLSIYIYIIILINSEQSVQCCGYTYMCKPIICELVNMVLMTQNSDGLVWQEWNMTHWADWASSGYHNTVCSSAWQLDVEESSINLSTITTVCVLLMVSAYINNNRCTIKLCVRACRMNDDALLENSTGLLFFKDQHM